VSYVSSRVLTEITSRNLGLRKVIYMTIKYRLLTSVAFSTAFLAAIATIPTARAEMSASGAEVVTNGPQTNPGDSSGSWSARQNVRDSERYEGGGALERQLPCQSCAKGMRADQRSAAACQLRRELPVGARACSC
jgi:hypothetical protein